MLISPLQPAQAAGFTTSFDQCANGVGTSTACTGWTNGTLQGNSSHYSEDQVVPQRLQAAPTDTADHTIKFSYQATKSGIHAYDSLATWNLTQFTADPCQDISATLCSGVPTTFQMVNDFNSVPPADPGISTVVHPTHDLPDSSRNWVAYNGSVTASTGITYNGDNAFVEITFHANSASTPVIILFGGHLAASGGPSVPRAWGVNLGASHVSGGPYQIKIESVDNGGGGASNNIQAAALVPGIPNFSITKSASPANPVAAGATVTYTITVTNNGTGPGSATFTDDFDDRLTPTPPTTVPGGGTCTREPSGTNRFFTCGTIQLAGSGGQQVFTYTAVMPSSFTSGQGATPCAANQYLVTNTATLATGGQQTANVCVTAAPSFTITKSVDPTTANAGDDVTYTVIVTNTGSAPGNTTFTDDYDDKLTIDPPAGCTLGLVGTNKVLNCATTTINPSLDEEFDYTVTLPSTFTGSPDTVNCGPNQFSIQNKATLFGLTSGPTATVCVNATPKFTISKTSDPTVTTPGQPVDYKIIVTNGGSASGVTTFVDDYDDRVTVTTPPAGCTAALVGTNKVLNCTTGTINGGGGTQEFDYTGTLPATFSGSKGTGCTTGQYAVTNTATLANMTKDDATVCVIAAPTFTVDKRSDKTTVPAGGAVQYTIEVDNTGNAAGGTSFTDNYDDRLNVTAPAGCSLGVVGSDKVLNCTTDDILAGGHQDFVYTVTMPATFSGPDDANGACGSGKFPVVNSVVVTDGGANDSQTVCVSAAPILHIAKSASPSNPLIPGASVTYVVTVSNTGTADGSTDFTDDYDDRLTPSGVTIDPVDSEAACTDADPGGNHELLCTSGTVPANGSRTFTYTATLPLTFTDPGTGCPSGQYAVKNTASFDGGANPPTATATVCVSAAPAFTITKTADPTDANPGQQVTYTVTVHNGGTASGSTTFTDDFDNRIDASITAPAGCTKTGGTLQCSTGTINAGADQTFTYKANMPASFNSLIAPRCANGKFSVTNTATLANGVKDTAVVCVNATPSFTITKSADPDSVDADGSVQYTITVTNGGTLDGSTTFQDDYDDRLDVTPPAGCSLAVVNSNKVLNCATGSIDALGGHQDFTYTVNMPASFSSTDTPGGPDCSASNPQQYPVTNSAKLANGLSDSVTVCVNAAPHFVVAKTSSPANPSAGDPVTYKVTVTNNGTASGFTMLTDNYDDRLNVTAPAGCQLATVGVDKVLNCTTGQIAPLGGTQQFIYTVNMPASFTGTSGSEDCDTGTFPVTNGVTLANGETAGKTVCVTAAPKFDMTKTATPHSNVAPGTTVTYVITITNSGTASGQTSFDDNYDDRLTPSEVTSDPAGGSCAKDPNVTTLHCSTSTLDAGQSQSFTYTAVMPSTFTGDPDTDACGPNGFLVKNSAGFVNAVAAAASGDVCVTATPAFVLTKSADPQTALPGQTVTYTVRVTNTGTAPGSTTFVDNYDDRLTPTTPTGCTAGSGQLSCTTTQINPGDHQDFVYTAVMPATFSGDPGTGCGDGQYAVENTATLQGHDTGITNTVCVNATPSFTIAKKADPATGVKAGDPVTYTITVHNGGTGSGSTTFQDDYDDRLNLTAPQGCTLAIVSGNKVLNCATGTVLAGDDKVFTYTVNMPALFSGVPGGMGCTASNPQTYPIHNAAKLANGISDEVTVCVQAAPDFKITKVASPSTTTAGGAVNYTITVRNDGTAAGTTTFTDNYDDRLTLSNVTISPPGGSCQNTTTGDKTLSCMTGTINGGGATQTFSYSANMPPSFSGVAGGGGGGGSQTCTAMNPQQYPVTNSAQLANGLNSTATVCVNAAPVAQLTKTVVKTVDTDGTDTLSYTITYKNTGAAESNTTVITDNIPSGTVFSSCGGCTTTVTNGVVTSVAWNDIGPVAALGGTGSVTLTVHVIATAVCQISNTAYIQFDANPVVASNTATITIDPLPNPAGAHASGSAIGAQVKLSGLLGINTQPIGQVSTVRNGLGPTQTANKSVLGVSLPANGSLVRIPVVNQTSASGVSANPAFAQDVTSAAVDHVCLMPIGNICTVQADTVQAVASTLATGAWATYSSGGSTIQNLKIVGIPTPVDLNTTLKVNLNPLLFGPGSYVAINERTGSAGLVGNTYVADAQVTLIHLVITGLLGLQAANVIVSQATSHADFPKTLVCGNVAHQSVSGHAFVAQLRNAPTLADTTLGYVAIPPTGANETQQLAGVQIPLGILGAAAGASRSFSNMSPSLSYAESSSEIAGNNGTQACVVKLSPTSCLITANLIHSQSQATASAAGAKATDAGTSLVNVSVAGIPLGLKIPPNTAIIIPGMGYVVLNEQMCDGGGLTYTHQCIGAHHAGLTVRAVDLVFTFLGSGLGVVPATQLIIGEAHSDATYGA